MILHFKKQLLEIMGDDARCTWSEELGIGGNIQQYNDATDTFMQVIDEAKAAKYINHADVDALTEAEADAVIDTLFVAEYSVSSEALMSANLTQKVNNNTISLDDISATATKQEELKFLYDAGISGITKSERSAKYSA